ncbi:MAG: hypothetical protein VYC34_03390, partial [Planctomycetota bacterium]|nr:hypothetical protein [Planctomycetota bacterium]
MNPQIVLKTGAALLLTAAFAVNAAPPPGGNTFEGPIETESNDRFPSRDFVAGDNRCRWFRDYSARLGDYEPDIPDTVLSVFSPVPPPDGEDYGEDLKPGATERGGLFAFNDDGGFWAQYGGSGIFSLPVGGSVPDSIRVTGKGCNPDGAFPCDHGQFGLVEIIVQFTGVGLPGPLLREDRFYGVLNNTNRIIFNRPAAPAGAVTWSVQTNVLASSYGDVDFYEFNSLRPNAPYNVTIIGGTHDFIDPSRALDTTLGSFDAGGSLIATNDDIGGVPWNPRSTLNMMSDAGGRIRFAVSGYSDFNFEGTNDTGTPLAGRLHD